MRLKFFTNEALDRIIKATDKSLTAQDIDRDSLRNELLNMPLVVDKLKQRYKRKYWEDRSEKAGQIAKSSKNLLNLLSGEIGTWVLDDDYTITRLIRVCDPPNCRNSLDGHEANQILINILGEVNRIAGDKADYADAASQKVIEEDWVRSINESLISGNLHNCFYRHWREGTKSGLIKFCVAVFEEFKKLGVPHFPIKISPATVKHALRERPRKSRRKGQKAEAKPK
jgi:hypothetical protein